MLADSLHAAHPSGMQIRPIPSSKAA